MLLEDFSRDCILLEPERVADGEGGFETVWNEGERFVAHIAMENSPESTRADKRGISVTFNVLVNKDVPIHYDGYFRDIEGGWTYRVITEPDMKKAPNMASFDLKNFTAQREDAP